MNLFTKYFDCMIVDTSALVQENVPLVCSAHDKTNSNTRFYVLLEAKLQLL
jgi:hypothetical protein